MSIKNNKSNMNVAFVITEKYFYIGYVAISSFLTHNKDVNLYIVHDETLPSDKLDELKNFEGHKYVKSFNIITIDSDKYKNFSIEHKVTYCFELAERVDVDKMLFIHSVDLVIEDLKELYDTDISDCPCAALEYVVPIKTVAPVHNSFILTNVTMLFNFKYLREHKYFEKLMSDEFYQENSQDKKITDMVIINNLMENCKQIPIKYGYEEIWFKKVEIQGNEATKALYNLYLSHLQKPAIISYDNKKPNQRGCKNSYLGLWWKYAKKTPIYEKIKYFAPKTKLENFILFFTSKKTRVQEIRKFQNTQTYKNMCFASRFVKPFWLGALLAFGLAIPIGCLDAVIALSLKPYMDVVMVEKSLQPSWQIPLLIVAFTSLQGILNFASSYANDWTIGKVSLKIKQALFDKLMHKSANFIDRTTSGDIQKRFNNDADRVCSGIFGGVKLIISRVFSSISLIGVLIYNSWQLAIIAILILLCAIFPLTKMKDRIKSVVNQSENSVSAVITDYNELFNGSKIIKAFNLYNLQNKIFDSHLDTIFNLRMQISRKTGIISPIMHIIVSLGIGIAIWYGSSLVISGTITSGNFVSFITALIMLYTPIKGLGGSFKNIQTSMIALERVTKQLEAKDYIIDKPDALELSNFNNCIEFEGVNFEYTKNKPVLKNINFAVNKGETFALVGNSGGGKSTIVSLLPRFYKIKKGSIKIDGVDISNYKINSLRDNISIVLQDNFLFAGTIRENILMGKLDANEEEIRQAVKNACLEEFVDSLEKGLDTYIGEKGVLLSGGQKQRVAIARAFLKDAPIVILDEATSALDNQSEAIVQKAIENLMQDKTVFVIAHRLSTIQNADRIAVINEGNLVELGTHEELMQIENGEYKKLYEMQFKNQEVFA